MRRAGRWIAGLSAAGLAALLSACAGVPRDVSLPINDPNEQFNRGVLHLNQVVLDPTATVIKQVPGPIRDRLQDLDANLKEPRVLGNDLLQGRFNAAAITVGRIIFNTTFGLGGLFDVASQGGLPQQTGDFGQTMFVWGVPSGALYRCLRILVLRRSAIRSAGSWTRSAILSGGLWAACGLDGRGGSGRARCRRSLTSRNGNRLRAPPSTSTRSGGRSTRRAGTSCARRSVCPRLSSRRPRRPRWRGAGHAGPGGGVAGLTPPPQ